MRIIILHDTSATTFYINVDAIEYFEDTLGEQGEFLFSTVYLRSGKSLLCDETSHEIVRLIRIESARS